MEKRISRRNFLEYTAIGIPVRFFLGPQITAAPERLIHTDRHVIVSHGWQGRGGR